jgi:hypothetical protein
VVFIVEKQDATCMAVYIAYVIKLQIIFFKFTNAMYHFYSY